MLALSEGLAAGSPEAYEASLKLLQSDGPLAGELEPITGLFFYKQWDALYREPLAPAMFMHQENAVEIRERHRALLKHSVQQARELAAAQIQKFNDLAETMKKLTEALQRGHLSGEVITQVAGWADMVHEGAWFLRGEELQTVSDRADHLEVRLQEVVEWAKTSGLEGTQAQQAHDLYTEICRYDVDVIHWLGLEEVLVKWMNLLRHLGAP